MRILSDTHHQGLTESLKLLFSKRLGWELRFPAGMEWYPDFWNVYPHESTAIQYLERETEGAMGISLEEFKNTKFDVLLCSIPQHVPIWLKLKDLFQPEVKLIFQVGNVWAFDNSFPIKNILASAIIPDLPGFNTCTYHEEFDLNIFHYESPRSEKKIYNFVNCLGAVDLYKEDWELFLELERLIPDWEFRSYGGQNRDGWCNGPQEVAEKMREATFIFNVKKNGDGFGFTIHEAAAVGRPIITRASDYKGKLAEPLIHPATGILIDGLEPEEIANTIEYNYYERQNFSSEIYKAFKENVDFDKEEIKIRRFLDNLL